MLWTALGWLFHCYGLEDAPDSHLSSTGHAAGSYWESLMNSNKAHGMACCSSRYLVCFSKFYSWKSLSISEAPLAWRRSFQFFSLSSEDA